MRSGKSRERQQAARHTVEGEVYVLSVPHCPCASPDDSGYTRPKHPDGLSFLLHHFKP